MSAVRVRMSVERVDGTNQYGSDVTTTLAEFRVDSQTGEALAVYMEALARLTEPRADVGIEIQQGSA